MAQLRHNSLEISRYLYIAGGAEVPVKLRHMTVSRPGPRPIVLIYTSIVRLMII